MDVQFYEESKPRGICINFCYVDKLGSYNFSARAVNSMIRAVAWTGFQGSCMSMVKIKP